MNLDKQTKETRVVTATVVGTTTINGAIVDMQDFEGVEFILQSGTITDGNLVLKAQDGNAANLSDAADLAGTATQLNNGQNAVAAVLDIFRPIKRFIRPVLVRGGATGAVIDSVIAIQYGARKFPVSNDATTVPVAKTVISPADGVA
jgi:hypothetical protein